MKTETIDPVRFILRTLNDHGVKSLLMGGQACIVYGGSEFSKDTDIACLASVDNIAAFTAALRTLQARRVAVPPFHPDYLHRGHAIHFRCGHSAARNMRIDVMAVMRNVDPFERLWMRKTQFRDEDGTAFDILSLPDLVLAKKTQRDKDWPMIRRLIEADYVRVRTPAPDRVEFWLLESRTPAMIVTLAAEHPDVVEALSAKRPLLQCALDNDESRLTDMLEEEEKRERQLDRQYWLPLRTELEALRRQGYDVEELV